MYKKRNRGSFGFTMIELLVVMAIMGVISSIIVAGVTVVKKKARDGQRETDIQRIASALERYRADYQQYPFADCTSSTQGPMSGLAGCLESPKTYLDAIPTDPLTSRGACGYLYKTDATGSTYSLYATLEQGNGTTQSLMCNGSSVTYNYQINNP